MYSFFRSSLSLCAAASRHERVCIQVRAKTSACLHTSVWKSPSDESGVLAEEESQFLLCSSIRSFCSPGTMDSSGVMVLKLSQELCSSGVDLSWLEREEKRRCLIRKNEPQKYFVDEKWYKTSIDCRFFLAHPDQKLRSHCRSWWLTLIFLLNFWPACISSMDDTPQNVCISSDWSSYKKFKKKKLVDLCCTHCQIKYGSHGFGPRLPALWT